MDERVTTPTGATGTNGLPTDADLIRLLRARVQRLETGVDDYLTAVHAYGAPVAGAWTALERALRDAGVDVRADPDAVAAFVVAYRDSLPKRKEALAGLLNAVRQDFREAVLTDPDMTDDQRATWVALCDAEAKEQEE